MELNLAKNFFKGIFLRIWGKIKWPGSLLSLFHITLPSCNLGNLDLEVIFCLHRIWHDLVDSESSTINSPELSGMTVF
jgi:hypothetical protein